MNFVNICGEENKKIFYLRKYLPSEAVPIFISRVSVSSRHLNYEWEVIIAARCACLCKLKKSNCPYREASCVHQIMRILCLIAKFISKWADKRFQLNIVSCPKKSRKKRLTEEISFFEKCYIDLNIHRLIVLNMCAQKQYLTMIGMVKQYARKFSL